MKVIGFTCTYNEADYIPYVMPYVTALGYDKFIVYDNESTDKTVELLKEYPFVEVRSYISNGVFDDQKKCELQQQAINECLYIADATNDYVWMSWTDFDEVIFVNSDVKIKNILSSAMYYGYNCFYKRMVNLFPPRWMVDSNMELPKWKMAHNTEGIRGSYWTGGGMKPLIILVNDFPNAKAMPGNHYMFAGEDGKRPNPMNKECELYAFHLKFIDKGLLLKKWRGYVDRGKEIYVEQIKNFNELYDSLYGVTFPMEQYFMADGFFSDWCRNGSPWSGIIQ